MQLRLLDLNEMVMNLARMLQRIIREDVRLQLHLHPAPLMTLADTGMLEQVLMNLAVNARDDMPRGGVLDITVSRVEIDGTEPELDGYLLGNYALITVSDSGEGMDKPTLRRVFEPYFSAKSTDRGTGLGLSMVYGIICQHDGAINVYSEPGEGTTFKIYLPLDDQNEQQVSARAEGQLPEAAEIILLVEDDPDVLATNKCLLEKSGYTILSACNGAEALELFKLGPDKISLVVLNVILPDMNGKEMFELLRAYKNNVKVIFASSHSATILNGIGCVQERINFVSKPMNSTLFLKRVRTLLDS